MQKYKCQHCDLKFGSKVGLRSHRATKHMEAKPFACGECGKCFGMQGMLTQHMRISHRGKGANKRRGRATKAANYNSSPTKTTVKVELAIGDETRRGTSALSAGTEDDFGELETIECKIEGDEFVFTSNPRSHF